MPYDISSSINNLMNGNPPDNPEIIRKLTAGINFLTDFWRDKYLSEYINAGGSKIKFLNCRSYCK